MPPTNHRLLVFLLALVFYFKATSHCPCGYSSDFYPWVYQACIMRAVCSIPGSITLFFFPSIMFALLFSLPPGRKSDPGSHSRLPPPLPTTVRALHFYRENSSDLPSSTRVDFYVVGYCLHIKPFLVYIPNISSSTPSALPDSS